MRIYYVFLCFMAGIILAQAAPEKKAPPPAAEKSPFVTDVQPQGRSPSDLAVDQVQLIAQPVAIERIKGTLDNAATLIPQKVNDLVGKLSKANVPAAGAPMAVFVDVTDINFTADIMVPVADKPATPPADIKFGDSPSGKALRIIHRGPLESIEDTYNELETFIEDKEVDLPDPAIHMERYLNNPTITAPTDMVTEVYVMLK